MSYLDLVRANVSRRAELMGELRQIDEAANADKRELTEDEAAKVSELRSTLTDLDGRITSGLEIEERSRNIEGGLQSLLSAVVDRENGEVTDERSLGRQFVETDEYRTLAARGGSGSAMPQVVYEGVDFRAVTNTTLGTTSGGAWVRPPLYPRVGQDFLDRRVYLLDRLPHVNTNEGAVVYVQDKTPLADMADLAVEVAEGTAKPQAGITTAVVTEAFATIAAWVNLTRQVVADSPQVQSYIDGRLRYSIKRRADKEVINGAGTGANLLGLAGRTGIITNAPAGAEARYVTIRHTITLMEQAESVPEIIVLNPADAELFDLSNSTTAGLHAVEMLDDNPGDQPTKRAWGMEQIRSNAVAAGTALLIDPLAVSIFDRQQPTAYLTDSHASNFTSNILTLLLEARVGLALFNPLGVAKITFNGTA